MKNKIMHSLVFILSFVLVLFVVTSCNTTKNDDPKTSSNDVSSLTDTTTSSTETITSSDDTTTSSTVSKTYTITWKDDKGKVLDVTTDVKEGVVPTYNGDTPTKEATDEFSYEFSGWTPTLTEAKEDATYVATFSSKKNQYTYTFYDNDGIKEFKKETVNYGTKIIAPKSKPSKSTETKFYVFDGWYTAIEGGTKVTTFPNITADVSYYARYIECTIAHTVTWLNDDGTLIDTTIVPTGKVPSHDTPTKESTEEYSYEFDGWYLGDTKVEEFGLLSSDVTYKAKFTPKKNQCTYTFYDNDGIKEFKKETVNYGTKIVAPTSNPSKSTETKLYVFDGWYTAIEGGTKVTTFPNITDDISYYARYIEYTVAHTVTWLNDDGTLIDTTIVPTSEVPSHDTPTKESTKEYSYEFDGWYLGDTKVEEFGLLSSDVTYKAKFTPIANKYTVTFNSNGGTSVTSKVVSYDSLIEKPKDPTLASKSFIGWYYNDKLWDFESDKMPATNIELKAKWEDLVIITLYMKKIDGSVEEVGTKEAKYSNGFPSISLYDYYELDNKYLASNWYDENGKVWYESDTFDSYQLEIYTDIYTKGLIFNTTSDNMYVSGYTGSEAIVEIPLTYCGKEVIWIGSKAFYGNTTITEVYLTKNIESINEKAFMSSSLKYISNSSKVKSLDPYCFSESDITSFNASSLETISEYAFAGCKNFVGFSSNTPAFTVIPNYAFYGCTSLTSYDFRNAVYTISFYAFANSGVKSITNYNNLTLIRSNAFEGSALESFEANSKLQIIEDYAFNNCANLSTFYLETGVKYVGAKILDGTNYQFKYINDNKYVGTKTNSYYLFYQVSSTSVTSILISTSCYVIAGEACANLTKLTKITIPDQVKGIGKKAFLNSKKLATVTISEDSDLRIIGEQAFANTAITQLFLPANIEYIGVAAFASTNITAVTSQRQVYYYLYTQIDQGIDWAPVLVGVDLSKYNEYAVSNDFVTMLTSSHYLFVYNSYKYLQS